MKNNVIYKVIDGKMTINFNKRKLVLWKTRFKPSYVVIEEDNDEGGDENG